MKTNSGRHASVINRGDRLNPSRLSRLYWHLRCLREALTHVIEDHLAKDPLDTLVDYGCGNLPYRPLFLPHVHRYLACDLPDNADADVKLDSSGRLPLAGDSADVVLSSQVLEHVPDPNLYLAESWRVLHPGGLLVLSTHGVWRFHPDPTDFWRWTSQGLRKLIETSRFEIVDFRGLMGPAAYGLQIFQDSVGACLWAPLATVWYAVMQVLIQLSDRLTPAASRLQDACVFVVVARKPCGGVRPTEV